MKPKAQVEIETAARIIETAQGDLLTLERWWPASKRGSNAQRALDDLRGRLEVAQTCLADAAKAVEAE